VAQKYLVQLIDDLSQEQIEDGAGESVAFGVDGASYAIDLTREHAAEFRALLEPYVTTARRADSATAPKRSSRPAAPKQDLKAVREWASANGYTVSDRGRVPNEVQKAFAAAH
jgi:hypothetical protein